MKQVIRIIGRADLEARGADRPVLRHKAGCTVAACRGLVAGGWWLVAGGWWPKTLADLGGLYVHFAACNEIERREHMMLQTVAAAVLPERRST